MSLARSSLLVGLGAIASRVLGFARDILFAQALGAGPVADAFLAAFRLPNLVRRVVGEGGLNPVLVPTLSRLNDKEAARMAGETAGTFALALLFVTALVEIGAGAFAFLLAPGLKDDGTLSLVALYTRLSFPIVLFVTLASIGAALLNLRGRFAMTALAPLVVNGGLIAALLLLQKTTLPEAEKAVGLALVSTLAGALHMALIAWALRRNSIPMLRRPSFRGSPVLKSTLRAGVPALVASGAVQIFLLVATQIASFWPSGVSWLYYAERVIQLPLGLIAALGAGVLLPHLALRHRQGGKETIVAAQNRALEAALLLAVPASAALLILAEPVTRVLFLRGAFQAADAQGTALVLAALSLGLPFAAAAKVLSQTLFARGFLRQALAAALMGLAAMAVAPLLAWPLGPAGVALAVSLACLVQAAAVVFFLKTVGLWAIDKAFARRLVKTALASLVMSLGLLASRGLAPEPGLAALLAQCAGGLALYALAAWVTGAASREDWARLMKTG